MKDPAFQTESSGCSPGPCGPRTPCAAWCESLGAPWAAALEARRGQSTRLGRGTLPPAHPDRHGCGCKVTDAWAAGPAGSASCCPSAALWPLPGDVPRRAVWLGGTCAWRAGPLPRQPRCRVRGSGCSPCRHVFRGDSLYDKCRCRCFSDVKWPST